MKKLFLVFLFLFSILQASSITKVVGISEKWEDATAEDCKGFYWEVAKEVFALSKITLECKLAPYERSVHSVKVGKADFWVASYLDEETFALYPKHYFDADMVSALYDKTKTTIHAPKDLENKKAVWMRGYAYNEYLDEKMNFREIDDRTGGIRMVVKGRVDVMLDAKVELDLALEKMKTQSPNLKTTTILKLPLYMGFKNNDRGKELVKIWDENMEKLHQSGKLKEIYKKADYTQIYPFDE